jgi:predicted kinase/ribosomal protein S18 acetylase RimI-like enzyme
MARLSIICGLPGSGKTTVATRLATATGASRMCPDEWMRDAGIDLWDQATRARLEATQWAVAQDLLVAGQDVVIEWGTWARAERDALRVWCRANDVQVSLVHLAVKTAVLRERLAARNGTAGEAVIPPHPIDEWIAGPWQPPTAGELALFDPIHLPDRAFTSRPWRAEDIPFLWEVLYLSIHIPEGRPPAPRSMLDAPDIAHYLRDFGRRAGDDAQIVTDDAGVPVAAAYCRRMRADDPGYGFVSADVPELGMAVLAAHRGRGLGRLVLEHLLERHPVMSLSVDLDNAAARHLYASMGFEWVADEGTAATMLRRPA